MKRAEAMRAVHACQLKPLGWATAAAPQAIPRTRSFTLVAIRLGDGLRVACSILFELGHHRRGPRKARSVCVAPDLIRHHGEGTPERRKRSMYQPPRGSRLGGAKLP